MARQVEKLRTSADWIAWLNLTSRFHKYSFLNVLLMHTQAEERRMARLTHIAGFRKWIDMKR